ncbi:MAG: UDP-N-acetylmuramoyl-tripeptide--D-alanyl-D-alanine ligase [Gammaproteobacteria bacterium]|nr:UDP-N-acetylmuramoyl-tripeptide--D-alanyl-D-alanine ligase [Gammaproteobacteria bacterium]
MKTLADYTLKNLANLLGVSFDGGDALFTGVSTDTRNIEKGNVFVALKGPNFDAHDYLDQAKEKGAIAAIVERDVESAIAQIKVKDTLVALGEMANARRNSFLGKVIGLTGSNGKTTVKELIASILNVSGNVLATQGNFNNDIGLPLTLLKIKNNEKYAVIEMGANHHGEIAYLSKITHPDIALITNAGSAHLEGFGSLKGVATAKGEIFGGLIDGGTAIINLDDNYSAYWLTVSEKFTQKTFSLSDESADIYASNIQPVKGGSEFDLHLSKQNVIKIHLPLSGKHNVANALVAATVANICDVPIADIKNGLEYFKMVKGRLTFMQGKNGSVVIDDTYNANLDSSKAAINVLSEQPGEKYFILGDLFESGDHAKQIHQEVGQYAKEQSIDHVLTVGELTQFTTESAGASAKHFNSKTELSEYLLPRLNDKSVLLIKGSRGMRMEKIVQKLI